MTFVIVGGMRVAGKARWAGLAAAALLWGMAAPASAAQAPGADGRTVYQADYFTQFAPSNALQMVQRVPGFTLELGNQEVRGFGQAAGNVVVNGQRPSSKSDTLETVLARIPASRVARVEVGPGDLFGSEFAGKPQVVNVVTTGAGGLAGTLNGQLRRTYTGRVEPDVTVSALLRRGKSSFNASAGYQAYPTTEEGFDRITALPSGRLIELREKVNRISDRTAFVSGAWEHNGGDNRTAHLNFRVSQNWFDLKQTNDVFPAAGAVRDDRLIQNYDRRDYELGGDITRPLWGGGLKLVGLATRRQRHNVDTSLNRVQGEAIGGFIQDLDNQRDERVLRLVWNRSNLGGWSIEAGAEGVLNKLDSDVGFFRLNAGGTQTRIDLPVDQAVVEEYRGEAFVNAGKALSKTLRLDMGLTYEGSRLTVSGDAEAERVLKFLKPKASLDYRDKSGWRAQLSVARTVAQLNFDDFISTAELSNDRVNGGNADLVPQRAWEILATLEQPILGDGMVKVQAGYNRISLVQDRIPTPEGFDAPGNLGNGRSLILRSTVDAPLARLGIEGGRLTVNSSLIDTSVEDPYTLRKRQFSGFNQFAADASFRQDLGKWAYGATLYYNEPTFFFRQNEIDRPWGRQPYVTAFVEYRPSPKTTITLSLDNATNTSASRERTFFDPDRRTPFPDELEFRHRNKHVIPAIGVKHSFG
ncbi:MAG: TonB-dependent receptor plug domain-containing protein [Allosphingosinicella sp.]